MRNPIEMMVQNMLRQAGNNPQAVVQNIMRNNPEFAKGLQGQNLQQLAMSEMQRRGINPQMFMNGIYNK